MKLSFLRKKWFKIPYTILLYGFAAYGFILTATYFAVKFNWTPAVGGSVYKIKDTDYTFGSVAYEFFYSGELADVFPYKKKSFDEPRTIIKRVEPGE
jgi:hypothetical protein